MGKTVRRTSKPPICCVVSWYLAIVRTFCAAVVAASIIDASSVGIEVGELTDDGEGYMEDVADMGDWAILGMIL